MSKYSGIKSSSLCWNCANACGNCEWSASLEPVKGWQAVRTFNEDYGEGYQVVQCPKFVRDAHKAGQIRMTEEELCCLLGKLPLENEEAVLPFYA